MKILVDKIDGYLLDNYNWFVGSRGYIYRQEKGKTIYLHRQIVNVIHGEQVDHIDRDPSNNKRSNLRICTQSQNMMNSSKMKNKTSKYKGVSFREDTKKWGAYIHSGKWCGDTKSKKISLGCWKTEVDAAEMYNLAAIMFYKEYANLNEVQ